MTGVERTMPIISPLPAAIALAESDPARGSTGKLNARPAHRISRWARRAAAAFWLRALMRTARHATWFALALRPVMVWGTWVSSPSIRAGTLANAGRILGPDAGDRAKSTLARRVVASFYDFVCDMGRNRRLDVQQLAALVDTVEGNEHFDLAVSRGRGVVVVTAHLGSFETAVAALRLRTGPIHVVFKRDDFPVFERMRSEQRRKLGVSEAHVEEGWPMWLRLRDALLRGEVALMQGDRLLPGQTGEIVPFLGGHLELPTGPAKLAIAAGSPLLPVFAVKDERSRIQLIVDEPIFIQPDAGVVQLREVMRLLAKAIERRVARCPEQWLMLHPVWCEDRAPMIQPLEHHEPA